MKKNQMKGHTGKTEDQAEKNTDKVARNKNLEDKGKRQKNTDKTQLGSRDFAANTKEVLRISAEFFSGRK